MLLMLVKIVFVLIHVAIAIYDFSFYRIPNVLLGGLLVLYALYAPIYLGSEKILSALIVFAIVLVISFGLFAIKYIGGGDAKYISVASLWAGGAGVVKFIFLVALIGGVLGLAYLLLRDHLARLSDKVWVQIQKGETRYPFLQYLWIGSGIGAEEGKREAISSRMLPYGVAIATGAIIMMMFNLAL